MVGQYLPQTNKKCYSILQYFLALQCFFSWKLNTARIAFVGTGGLGHVGNTSEKKTLGFLNCSTRDVLQLLLVQEAEEVRV